MLLRFAEWLNPYSFGTKIFCFPNGPGACLTYAPNTADAQRHGGTGVAGYQDAINHRVATIDPCGCAPVGSEHSVKRAHKYANFRPERDNQHDRTD